MKKLIQEVNWRIPLFSASVVAGFPSPADAYVDRKINLNDEFLTNKYNSYVYTVQSDWGNFFQDDILIIDCKITPSQDSVVLIRNPELKIKRYREIQESVEVIGAATSVIRPFRSVIIQEHIEQTDLNKMLIRNKPATFLVRAAGNSMAPTIVEKDYLVVDFSLEPGNGDIIIVAVDGELTVKRIILEKGRRFLVPDNPLFPPIKISDFQDDRLYGVVTSIIRRL